MVAKIKSGKSLTGLVFYNEKKVAKEQAKNLMASGYLKDVKDLSLPEKIGRLADLADRNQRTKTNAVHISLNFAVGEKLDEETLEDISRRYMQGIGFGEQPYLVYQHFDAGHPHIHIVTTNISRTGQRISLHNLGREKSEPVRKEIENAFGLQKAGNQQDAIEPTNIKPLQVLVYGKTETKRAMAAVVNEVVRNYRFATLRELNTLLERYHIQADRGSGHSVMFKHGGLRYWALDANRKRIGVPIKASSIAGKPTLKLLEKRFHLNVFLRKADLPKLKHKLDAVLSTAKNEHAFLTDLQHLGVDCILHKNETGRCFGVTYIDHQEKLVVKGSDLGKEYSATNIQKAWSGVAPVETIHNKNQQGIKQRDSGVYEHNAMLETLFGIGQQADNIPQEQMKKKRKKKRRLHL